MTRQVALYGGSFNPPGRHHRQAVELLCRVLDEVRVIPCGPRPDKPTTDAIAAVHRAAMADLTFGDLPGVSVDLFDLEADTFTRTWELQERYRDQGEVWHVVGADLVAGGARGEAPIQRQWSRGEHLWSQGRFVVLHRPGSPLTPEDLPPHHRVLEAHIEGESTTIRERLFRGEPVADALLPAVADYVERHALYRGLPPRRSTRITLPELRPLVVADSRHERALALAEPFRGEAEPADPNVILVVGGDGTMLRAIRTHWRRRLPFYGINAGHLGFLLNRAPPDRAAPGALTGELLPLLWVETEDLDGQAHECLAFNDAWVERASGQTACLRVVVDERVRISPLVADGALVSTAAGSASYARAMGAQPLPLGTPALLLVGSNVLRPPVFRPVVLPLHARVELASLDPEKRPLHGFVDGVPKGRVRRLRARVSRIAAVELAFAPETHPAEKLARIQFPLADPGPLEPS